MTKNRDCHRCDLIIRHSLGLRDSDFAILLTWHLTLPRAAHAGRRQNLFPAKSAQFPERDLPESDVRPWKGRWRHYVAERDALTLRSSKERNARHELCSRP